MDKRQKQILNATVEQYIDNAEPIGSQSLQKNTGFEVSSATLRNELKKLDEEGYLTQIHTSSGRVPTDLGYRFYVENIADSPVLSSDEESVINEFKWVGKTLRETLDEITTMMTEITDYTTLVVMPNMFLDALRAVHFVLVDIDTVLVVLLNSMGVNNEVLLKISERVSQEDLDKLSRWLSEKLSGKPFQPLSKSQFEQLRMELPQANKVMAEINKKLTRSINKQKSEQHLITKGVGNMITLPEFENIELTKNVITTLEENKLLLELFSSYIEKEDVRVVIGDENQLQSLKFCSLVLAPYSVNSEKVGMIGVLGPRRMRYNATLPLVKGLTQSLTNFLNQHHERLE